MQKFFEILLENLSDMVSVLTPICCCKEGFNVVRTTLGKPDKIYTTGLCFKIPIFQNFEKVNMKKQVHFLNAHSVKAPKDKPVPYNITIDAQVEFKILTP